MLLARLLSLSLICAAVPYIARIVEIIRRICFAAHVIMAICLVQTVALGVYLTRNPNCVLCALKMAVTAQFLSCLAALRSSSAKPKDVAPWFSVSAAGV